jgi:hypothetical protein
MGRFHSGIRIDKVKVEGAGGAIFVVGMIGLLVLSMPSMVPLMALCALGGVALAPVLHRHYYY